MTAWRSEMIWRWVFGSMIGTLLVAITSPLFVRSYLPRIYDSTRGVLVPQGGNHYRWRSEGYADTFIGPHGMPGRRDVPSHDANAVRIAIWGDSQAEGVCVDDEDKLHAQIERTVGQDLTVFPLARSGDDASDWLRQIPSVEQSLDIDVHVLLIVDLVDLAVAIDSEENSEDGPSKSGVAELLPAFVIESARRLLTDVDDEPRRLRFSLGPVEPPTALARPAKRTIPWDAIIKRLDDATDSPIMIVYAPLLPNITDGRIRTNDVDAEQFESFRDIAAGAGIAVVDIRDSMRQSAASGEWPLGFHNGRIGSGHFNATGYRIIAKHVADALPNIARRE